MPDVLARALDAVRMQVGKVRVVAVAVERLLGGPLEDDDRARLNTAFGRLAELSQSHDAATVRLDLFRRSSRIGQIFVLVRDVEEVEGVDGLGHRRFSGLRQEVW